MKKAVQKNAVIGVTIDKAKLRDATDKYLNASAVYTAIKGLAKFNLSNLGDYWLNIVALVNAVISAVEIAKAELVKGQPDGTKISGALAATVAIDILDECISFTGVAGKILEMIDGAILKLLVNIVLGDRHSANWLDEAFGILGLQPD